MSEADGSNDKAASFSAILKTQVDRCALLTFLEMPRPAAWLVLWQ